MSLWSSRVSLQYSCLQLKDLICTMQCIRKRYQHNSSRCHFQPCIGLNPSSSISCCFFSTIIIQNFSKATNCFVDIENMTFMTSRLWFCSKVEFFVSLCFKINLRSASLTSVLHSICWIVSFCTAYQNSSMWDLHLQYCDMTNEITSLCYL